MTNDPEAPDVGALNDGNATTWRVWASRAEGVELVLDPEGTPQRLPMRADGRGYFSVRTARAAHGQRYGFSLDSGPVLPDPCSRWQPDGVMRPSAVDIGQHDWDDPAWNGVARSELVTYELHVGTFTPDGTFDAVIPRLTALKEVGVTAVELMPVNQFPGRWSWGYDGVHPFAPQNTYGGPEGLRGLVAACHREGLAVFLDVVFNHFGPEGNVFPAFGDYLTEKYRTDWGPALNFATRGCDAVRAMVRQNVRMWVRDFRVDGLRFDAADQIYDHGPRHILADLAEVAHAEAEARGWPVHVFAETDLNDAPRFLLPNDRGGYNFDGHWNDDFHHAAHNVLTGENNGYYADFAAGPAAFEKALREVFVNNGNYSEFRGRRHGTSAREFSGDRFVAFTQNHDQVGNRLASDRLGASLSPSALRLAAGMLLLSPRLPLLFMGEEYGETNPFPYFCDFQSTELIEAVRNGRKAEFAHFGWENEPPDPTDDATRGLAVLSWDWSDPQRSGLRRLYQELFRLRREAPALRDFGPVETRRYGPKGDVLEMVRGAGGSAPLAVVFNLSGESRELEQTQGTGMPWFRSERPEFGAVADDPPDEGTLRPHEFVIFGGPV